MDRNSIQDAADKAGVPVGELREWLLTNVRATPQRWAKWNHDREPIPEKHIIAFLKDKLARSQSVSSGMWAGLSDHVSALMESLRADLERLERSESPLRDPTIEHIKRQIALLALAIGPPLPPEDARGAPPDRGRVSASQHPPTGTRAQQGHRSQEGVRDSAPSSPPVTAPGRAATGRRGSRSA